MKISAVGHSVATKRLRPAAYLGRNLGSLEPVAEGKPLFVKFDDCCQR